MQEIRKKDLKLMFGRVNGKQVGGDLQMPYLQDKYFTFINLLLKYKSSIAFIKSLLKYNNDNNLKK